MADRKTEILKATIGVIARRGVRGMRVQEVAADAGVSVPLIYHHFGSREGLLEAAMLRANDDATGYTAREAKGAKSAREELVATLLGEFQAKPKVRATSAAWGELRWSAVFDKGLRPVVHRLTGDWVAEVASLIRAVEADEGVRVADADASAERLVALVEGLSGRWLTGAADLDRVRELLASGIALEVPSP